MIEPPSSDAPVPAAPDAPAEVHQMVTTIENTRFSNTRLRPGYNEKEVDDFLDEVVRFLTGRSATPIGGWQVRNRVFRTTRLRSGYDEQEVDDFLDWLEASLVRLGHR